MTHLSQSEMRVWRLKRRSSTKRRFMSAAEKARKGKEAFQPSTPTTILQIGPNFDHVMNDQGHQDTLAMEGTDSQPPAIMPELSAHKPILIPSLELEITPFTTSEIDRLIPVVQILVDRGRLARGKVTKCGSAVSVMETILNRTSLIKEGIEEVIADCEAKSKNKQKGCPQISSRISEQILGLMCALEGHKNKTLRELRKVPMILLEIVAETCESLEKVYKDGDLCAASVAKIEGMFGEYRAVINQFRYLGERPFQLLQREIRLYHWFMEKALDHRDLEE
jgi:hypothetical protein